MAAAPPPEYYTRIAQRLLAMAAWVEHSGFGGVGCQLSADIRRRGDPFAAAFCSGGDVCVPRTSSKSCDQAIFVDQATGASVSSDAVLVEIDRLG